MERKGEETGKGRKSEIAEGGGKGRVGKEFKRNRRDRQTDGQVLGVKSSQGKKGKIASKLVGHKERMINLKEKVCT